MVDISRRGFFKIIGLAATSATAGCSADSARRLIPYIIPDEDIIPGKPSWYATTCRECPAGCGMLAKNRDGRIIKVEGNPAHPVNRGALCARGQASLHGLYNPDRFSGPRVRQGNRLAPVSWPEARKDLIDSLRTIYRQRRAKHVVFLTGLTDNTMTELIGKWLTALGGGEHVIYEPFAYEHLRVANRTVFGEDAIPFYRLDQADLLISLGAGFLETWLSNVEYARLFADFHSPRGDRKNFFLYVGSRRSMTAASSDLQILVEPGGELALAIALIEKLLTRASQGTFFLDPGLQAALGNALRSGSWAGEIERFAVNPAIIDSLADRFIKAKRPLVLAPGLPYSGPHALATAVAANLLCLLKPGSRQLIDFSRAAALNRTVPASTLKGLTERMKGGKIDLLLLHEANPVFTLPGSWNLPEKFRQAKRIVSFSSCPDETTDLAHLVLPAHTPLESWGSYEPRQGISGLMQPVMGPLFDSRHLGDLLLESAREAGFGQKFPWPDFYALLRERWQEKWRAAASPADFESFWQKGLQQGGFWEAANSGPQPPGLTPDFNYVFPDPAGIPGPGRKFSLIIYPTIQFFDGRMANRAWLQELPDPMIQTTWGGWVEINPETAARLGLARGDAVRISTDHGAIEVPVMPIDTVPEDVMAMPIGQGHNRYGRFADNRPANPLLLLPPSVDPFSGAMEPAPEAAITRTGRVHPVAHTDGSFFQQGRNLVEEEPFTVYLKEVAKGRQPAVEVPLPFGFKPHRDFYPPHVHKEFRWCMVVDLDRCIGCGACVVACYAENNVAIVGREQMLLGREMSWLRIQRYFGDDGASIRYLPMLCQHCDEAPCEAVCPIFAPHHSVEGLNNQVYNRCFGTRFCSQNDPYKVRRFNWFTFTRPTPLDWQLNPDVTVRQKGVMEKCSFCVQRIVAAKFKVKEENRKLKDGEFTTACAQTCPTAALTFGNLLDPQSRVAVMIKDARAYQVLRHLNTKPAVIYLKKLTQEL